MTFDQLATTLIALLVAGAGLIVLDLLADLYERRGGR